MTSQRLSIAFTLCALTACSTSLDASLDGKRCTAAGACVRGYVCSPEGYCERPDHVSSALDAAIVDASADEPDAWDVAKDAAASLTQADAGHALDASHVGSPRATAPVADADAEPATLSDAAANRDASDAEPLAATNGTQSPPATITAAESPTSATSTPTVASTPTAGSTSQTGTAGSAAPPSETPAPTNEMPPATDKSAPRGMSASPPDSMPAACPVEHAKCGDQCIDLQTDPVHCGACDQACDKKESCQAGSCKKSNGSQGPKSD